MESLDGPTWRASADAHRARVERWALPHRARRRRGFLFTHYSLRPARLEQWHPGLGVLLSAVVEQLPVHDLADLGYPPVRIETAAGRAEYARAQAGFAERAAPLRARLVAVCEELLGAHYGSDSLSVLAVVVVV